ncbi:hypothetical protein Tco_1345897 [Tanacetum coccineum]
MISQFRYPVKMRLKLKLKSKTLQFPQTPPPSPRTIKIQELTNQVLFLQSQKYKLEKEKTDVEAKVTNMKALPSYLNVQQLTELLVNSLKPEFVKLIKAHDFSSFIPTELKDLPRKFKAMNGTLALTTKVDNLEGSKLEIQVDLVALHGQVSSISSQLAKLKVLDAISTILYKVVAAMDSEVEQSKDKRKKAMSQEYVVNKESDRDSNAESRPTGTLEESSKSKPLKKITYITETGEKHQMTKEEIKNQKGIEEFVKADAVRSERKSGKKFLIRTLGQDVVEKVYKDEVEYDKYYLKMLNIRAQGKITNYDVLTRGKGPINLKVCRDDGSTKIIHNFKISDPHVGKWKEVLDAFPKRLGFAVVLAVLITGASQSRQHGITLMFWQNHKDNAKDS